MSDKLLDDIKAALEEASKHPGFYNVSYQEPIVSDIELRIRKEVMDAVDGLCGDLQTPPYHYEKTMGLLSTIKDRLNLLWGER